MDSTTAGFNQSSSFYIKAGSATLTMQSGMIRLDNGTGASITLLGGMILADGPAKVDVKSGIMMNLDGGVIVNIKAGAIISGKAGLIKMNG